MDGRGWTRIISGKGIYAKGGYRIQRNSRSWSWWAALQLTPDYPRGRTRTLREAKAAAEAAMQQEKSA